MKAWNFVRSLAIPKRWKEVASTPTTPSPPQTTSANDVVDSDEDHANSSSTPHPATHTDEQDETVADSYAAATTPPQSNPDDFDFGPALPPLAPLQRTLYLVDKKARLTVDNQRYQVERDDKAILSLPAHQADQIMLFGSVQVTTQALQLAARNECSLSYLSYLGRYYGRFDPVSGQYIALLQTQFSCHTDTQFQLDIARIIVAAKLHNCGLLLTRSQRHHKSAMLDSATKQQLKEIEQSLKTTTSMESLRGSEGAAAALY